MHVNNNPLIINRFLWDFEPIRQSPYDDNIQGGNYDYSVMSGIPDYIKGCWHVSPLVMYKTVSWRFDCQQAHFINTSFVNTIATGTYARFTVFINCNLIESIISGSNLFQAKIINCNLQNAEMMFCDLGLCTIVNSNFKGTNLYGARLPRDPDMLVNHNTTFFDGTRIDGKLNNLVEIEKGIKTRTGDEVWFKCPNGCSWKKSISEFLHMPKCNICCPSPLLPLRKFTYNLERKMTNDNLQLSDFLSPVNFLLNNYNINQYREHCL